MITAKEKQCPISVANHYNNLDQFYRKVWGEHLHHGYWKQGTESVEQATEQLVDLVAKAGEIGENDSVCDVGCGYGGTARLLAKKYKALVTALTLSKNQWEYAYMQNPFSSNPNYLLENFLQNSFPDNKFDVVISIESSEHMEDKEQFFFEVKRILKPQGRFVTCTWLSKEQPNHFEVKYLLEPICREGRLPSMGSELDYRMFLKKTGFSEILFSDISQYVKKTWGICAARTFKQFFLDKNLRNYLFNKNSSDRIFAKTLLRIWTAYQCKAMRYGIFSAKKSDLQKTSIEYDHIS